MTAHTFTRRAFLKTAAGWAAGTSLAGAGTLAYGHFIEANWVEVKSVPLTLPRLAPAFDGYTVAQVSDIHLGYPITRAQLAHVVDLTNAGKPDLVALTGDFVTSYPEHTAPGLIAELGRLRARDGVVAVIGNHDQWTNPWVVREVIRGSNALDLTNRVHTIERQGALLHVAGVDDVWSGTPRLDLVLSKLPASGAAILLAHEPDYADVSARTGRFALQLSGHSHGGQIIAPFYGPLLSVPYARKYPLGQYQVGSMIQYTNRGIGQSGLYLRLNCRPEITMLTLHASGDSPA